MSRSSRIEYPGAWYHVINRGAGGRSIFHNEQQYKLFLDLLSDAYSRFNIEIHAYSLMDNHYHLLLHTPLGNLGQAMKHINGLYTVRFNRLANNDGSLFRGRYKAILVDAHNYLLQLSRYIHLSPVFSGITNLPEQYPWSSYQYFMEAQGKPHWLNIHETLRHFGPPCPIEHYKKFVTDGIEKTLDKKMKEFIANVTHVGILGSGYFSKEVQEKVVDPCNLTRVPGYVPVDREHHPSVQEVIKATAEFFKVPYEEIIVYNRNSENLPRKVALYLAYSLTHKNRKTIASLFGNITNSAVSKAYERMEEVIIKDKGLADKITSLKRALSIADPT